MASQVWRLNSITDLAGGQPEVLGTPRLQAEAAGPVVAFDGLADGLVLDVNPLAGAARWTIELVFRPEPGGEREQRVLHVQETGSQNRMLIETRVRDEHTWFVDTFVRSGEISLTLYADRFPHAFGPWYHVALVCDGRQARHYVDGGLELSGAINFAPLGPGQTSLGVRLNRVSWFRGSIQAVSFTPGALATDAFCLRPAGGWHA